MCGYEVFIYPSVLVVADGSCTVLSPNANSSSAQGITGLVKTNRPDLVINFIDHHVFVLIKVFCVLGFSVLGVWVKVTVLWPGECFNYFFI